MTDARLHWNRRYEERPWPRTPSGWLLEVADLLPESGAALDVAGGTGRNAVWLASRGWRVTIVDVSDRGLDLARRHAAEAGVELTLRRLDLEREPLPAGPWDLLLCCHYLQRDLFPEMTVRLRPGGLLVACVATLTNLERHERPPRSHLLADGELPSLLDGLEILRSEEGWFDDHHEARVLARRPDPTS